MQVIEMSARVLRKMHSNTLTSIINLAFTLKSQSYNNRAVLLIKECF